jgi:MarR family transcriptional regulator, lower aerobic nicotinate degradation pathway regulator
MTSDPVAADKLTRDAPAEGRKAPPPLPRSAAGHVGFLLAQGHMAARELGNTVLAEFDLDVREYGALLILTNEGPLSQHGLGALQRCDRTTMVAIVDHLEALGLVERRRNPTDRRAYALETTAAGSRVVRRARKKVQAAERDLLAALSTREGEELRALLQRMLGG